MAFASGAGTAPHDAGRDFALGLPGWRYGDLYDPARLGELDRAFRARLAAADRELGARFDAYRDGAALAPTAESELLIAVGRQLGPFVAELFGAGAVEAHEVLRAAAAREQVIFRFKE